jgi:hypothetical protein
MYKYFIVAVLLAAVPSCPKPPEPPKTCPEVCPIGTVCTDGSKGCETLPPPGHVCEVGKEFCNCYVMVPGSNVWTVALCPADQGCTTDYQCKVVTPEDPCQNISCNQGWYCDNGICVKDIIVPPPTDTSCPKKLAPGSSVYLNNKRYGNGLDSTVRVRGDIAFCQMIHGVAVNDCHLEGWAKRSECEMELLSGCPIWEYSVNGVDRSDRCYQKPNDPASCDHFGDPVTRDDPQTPEFEGYPKECGLQRDSNNDPTAGFFIIGHGNTYFRACRPDGLACGPWVAGKDKS